MKGTAWTQGWRDRLWSQLNQEWDIIVIGGGITGAGILREAARAGLRVLLLEKGDFASGTSSHSSKLVHGGLRYLRNGQLKTTVSSVNERRRLLREGKGLVTPLGFLFLLFEGDRTPRWLVGLGLAFYDLLGLRWGHKYYDAQGIHRLGPEITRQGLLGGYRYFDAQTDDARLVLRIIQEAVRDGGAAINYAAVDRLLTRRDGQVIGAAFRDLSPGGAGRTIELKSKVVVNAAGAAADMFRGQIGAEPRLRYLRGSHLVFARKNFPVTRAITFAHPVDLRPVFAIPWEGVTLFGTTDIEHRGSPDQPPSISPSEVDYLMVAISYAFPGLGLGKEDIQATFSGIRSVVNTGKANPSKESREHVLWRENGLLTVSGGKLTTFRVMARDALRSLRNQLPGTSRFRGQRVLDESDMPEMNLLDPAERARLSGRYGIEARGLVETADPDELTTVDDTGQVRTLWAELRWAARQEGVIHLDDLLLRRVRIGLQLPHGALPIMDEIRAAVQGDLGWDDARWQREVDAYRRLWCTSYSLPTDY